MRVSRVCVAWGIVALALSWTAAAEPLKVDLSSVSEPGLCGMFAKLQPGALEVDGVPFAIADARTAVHAGEKRRIDFPPTRCAGLHFLHFTENAGDRIGSYTLIYEDGSREELALRGGMNINDWWKPGPLVFAGQAHLDALKREDGEQPVGFWRFSARNPKPDAPIAGIEVVNSDTVVTINLIAITLTDTCEDKIGNVPVWVNGMDEEAFLLAILSQPSGVAGKEKACEELRRVGSLKSVPALAAYLGDEKLSHAARLALTGMEYPEAHTAIRDALGTATGAIKAGLIESLGTMRDPADVALIAPSLRDKDPATAMAAALALGRLGGPDAVDALKTAAQDGSGRFRMAVLNSLLRCAEALCGKDDAAANALYTDVFNQWGRDYVGAAAYKGMIRTSGDKAGDLIASALQGSNRALWDAALPAVRDTEGAAITQTCAALVGSVPKDVLPGLVEALAQRGDTAAAPALASLVEDADPAIASAAIRGLAQIGDGGTAPVLIKAAAHRDEPDRSAAMEALLQIHTPDVSKALLAQLESADTAEATVIAKGMGQRRDESVCPALRKLLDSADGGLRTAAAEALAETGVGSDAELLCKALERADNEKATTAIKRALVTLGGRLGAPPEFCSAVLDTLNKGSVPSRCAMLSVCGSLRNAELLQALAAATDDASPEVKDAAIRALADSENPDALAPMLTLLDKTSDLTQRVLVFRGIARLASSSKDLDVKVREDALTRSLALAERPEEKKLFLGALASCPTLTAMKTVEGCLPSNDVVAEAVMAWGQIAKALLAEHAAEVGATAPAVLARAQEAGIPKEALQPLTDVMRVLAATPVPADQVHFEHVVIDKAFRSEGVAVADVDRDGASDIIAGDLWYSAPDWKPHEIRAPQAYDPNTGYSHCFLNFAMDVDEDGWVDSIEFGGPGAPVYWYHNPGEAGGLWKEYLLASQANGETFVFGDLLGDGKPVLIFGYNKRIAWFRPGQDKTAPWPASSFSHMTDLGHGLGMGDMNRDGRMDVLYTDGWCEGPVDRTRPDWGFHRVALGPACAQMLVYDVDGDGDSDVITSSAHDYGIWWFEQCQENNETVFKQHEIDKSISQTHALILADINNDGLPDLVTGKRYYAHCGHDPGAHEPAVLCWFELQRPEPGKPEYRKHEIDSDSGVGTQFEVCDLDGDGLQDVVASNKKGVHIFLQRRSK